jgi:hypothetical protein
LIITIVSYRPYPFGIHDILDYFLVIHFISKLKSQLEFSSSMSAFKVQLSTQLSLSSMILPLFLQIAKQPFLIF